MSADIEDPFEVATARSIFGSESLVEKFHRGAMRTSETVNLLGEKVQSKRLQGWMNFDDLVCHLSVIYKVDAES